MAAPSTNPLASISDALANLAATAGKSIVQVNARRRMPASGIVFDRDLVITADHVIEREEDITITAEDGRSLPAVIAGRDPARDLALLRVNEAALTPAQQASSPARVAELVLALARPDSTGIQASLGTVSAIGGPVRVGQGAVLDSYIRTDTFPFPGFSGGALVNVAGFVVGLNTSAMASGTLLTIPASVVWEAANSLKLHGHIRRGYIGVRSQSVRLAATQTAAIGRQQEMGLLLVSIENDSPAAQAGLVVGDILVGANGQPLSDHDDLQMSLSSQTVGASQNFEVLRGSAKHTVTVTIGERK
jgi:S1-C subfamily serine protease